MFKKIFEYNNLEELEQDLMRADTKENYDRLWNDVNIKQTVSRDQIKTMIGVSRTRIENLVNALEDVLDNVRLYGNNFDPRSTKSSNQERQGLKILTPNQMLSRLPIPLAQLKAWNNSEKLKNEM